MAKVELWSLPAYELASRLASGSVTSVEIVEALLERRRAVEPMLNAFVAECDALEQARRSDAARARGGDVGPLHGLPITIKDNVDLEGMDSTLGVRARVDRPARRDAILVNALRRAGVVFLGKTNVPQALLAQETENIVFGTTCNPWDTTRVPGGSSGGEAAAVAAGMSPLGIGTDIGGSIRIPAHFCGVVGFKPTLSRWSNRGSNTAIPGQELVRAQVGTLTRRVADAALLWRSLAPENMSRFDPAVPPLEAADPEGVRLDGLRIGIVDDDDFLSPTAAIRRSVGRAREVLAAAGATVTPHSPVPSREVLAVWLSALTSDGGRTLDAAIGEDPVSPVLKPSRMLLRVPGPLRRTAGRVLGGLGEERLQLLLDVLGEKTVTDLWRLTQRRTEMRLAELDAWNRLDLDAVICPPHVVAAMGHRESADYAVSLGAQFRWTLLDFPAGIVPVSVVRESEVGSYPVTDRISKKTARLERESVGLPVGVQVVARPYREHVLLSVMAAIEAGVQGDREVPVTPVTPR